MWDEDQKKRQETWKRRKKIRGGKRLQTVKKDKTDRRKSARGQQFHKEKGEKTTKSVAFSFGKREKRPKQIAGLLTCWKRRGGWGG